MAIAAINVQYGAFPSNMTIALFNHFAGAGQAASVDRDGRVLLYKGASIGISHNKH